MDFSDANFQKEVLESDVPVLVDFWAPWCGPCQTMKPIMEELEKDFKDKKIKIGKLNVDENNATAGQYSVMSIPAFKVFKDGKIIDEVVGGQTKDQLVKLIEKVLK